jgi:hypothetical protein
MKRFPFRRARTTEEKTKTDGASRLRRHTTSIGGFVFKRTSSARKYPGLPLNNKSLSLTRQRSDVLSKPFNLLRKLSDISHKRREERPTCIQTSDPVILLDDNTDIDALLNGEYPSSPNKQIIQQNCSTNLKTEGNKFDKLSRAVINLLCDGMCCVT